MADFNMTPNMPDYIREQVEEQIYPSKTYRIDPVNKRIIGIVDGAEAMAQAVSLHLSTERYDYDIFPDEDYGIETNDLYGKDVYYIATVLERRIKDALSIDTRVKGFGEYNAYIYNTYIEASIEVYTTEGTIPVSYSYNLTKSGG